MRDYYKVLHYLHDSKVDRQEPCDFESLIIIGDSIVIPTIWDNFNGSDYIEVFLNCHGNDIDVPAVTLGFSPLINGNASIISLNADNDIIEPDEDTCIRFTIDSNFQARDKSRYLTGIHSLKLLFNEEVNGLEIQKIFIRTIDYTYTLSDLKIACENGEAYVLRRLNNMMNELREIKEIPKLLRQYVFMAAAAYAWLTRWEYESKPMKEPKSESLNYADRLFNQVDDAITKYLSNIENNRDEEYVDVHQMASADITWGIR